jgi:hypothetical protein
LEEIALLWYHVGVNVSNVSQGEGGASVTAHRGRPPDWLLLLLVFAGSFTLYVRTLAPTVVTVFDDSPEFQLVCHLLGVAHPTGYPLYTLLGKLFTLLPPGNIAYRVNLMSAVFAALTAGVLALLVRELTGRPLAGVLAALALAVSPIFWSQATIAEVYPLHLFLLVVILWLLARWDGAGAAGNRWLIALAATCGLGLTHHRMVLLFAPGIALALYLAWRGWPASEGSRRRAGWPAWWRLALAGLLPLGLYLYIPLVGARVGSLDGSYQNTVAGFFRHVLALDYSVFFTDNPLAQSRALSYYLDTLRGQFGLVGTVIGLVGLIAPWRRRRIWLGTLLSLVICALFALFYQVADIEVFLLPVFLLWAVGIGAALGGIQNLDSRWPAPAWRREAGVMTALLTLTFIAQPIAVAAEAWPAMDRSRDWGVYDEAMMILSHPLPERATIIGILGETTVLRYVQETSGLRTDLELIAADRESDRMAALEQVLSQGGEAYLTRSLAGAAERYHFDSAGPLIRVQPKPAAVTDAVCAGTFAWNVLCLEGYDVALWQAHSASTVRIALQWRLLSPSTDDVRVSVRLIAPDGRLLTQHDGRPVHDTYPISAWVAGERVYDQHDLRAPPGARYGDYTIELVLYDPANGDELARGVLGQTGLSNLAASSVLPAPDALQVDVRDHVVWGKSLELLGHSVHGETFAPGQGVRMEFLWRTGGLADDLAYTQIWLCKDGLPIERSFHLAYVNPQTRYGRQMLVRQYMDYVLPANLSDGVYGLYVGVLDGTSARPAAPAWLPWLPGSTERRLQDLTVVGRERLYELPTTANDLAVAFGPAISLRGWELTPDAPRPGDALDLRLIWQAQSEMTVAYAVFVHVTDEAGAIVAQRDSQPGAGALPTTSWVAGEVIDDVHLITLPAPLSPGRYQIIVGLYDPLTDQRLPVSGSAAGVRPDHLVLKEVSIP